MRITREHVAAFGYWRTPASIRALAPKMQKPCIHRLINEHAGIKDKDIGINALHLLALKLRNKETIDEALTPARWDAYNIPKRYFAFRRWHAALLKARSR